MVADTDNSDSMEHAVRKIRLPLVVASAVIGIAVIIVAYFSFMPYWIIINKAPAELKSSVAPDRIIILISDKQLAELPALRQAIQQVETTSMTAVKVSNLSEGEKLTDLLKDQRLYYVLGDDVTLRYGTNEYEIHLERGYDLAEKRQ
jgi:hypothetical protein